MRHFSPHLEILPPPQRKLWNELSEVSREFVLYRGTALALHLGHRSSVDFDLFGGRVLDLSQIEQGISFLKGANIIQRDKNTLISIVDRGGASTWRAASHFQPISGTRHEGIKRRHQENADQ